jgi:hypothetical protein
MNRIVLVLALVLTSPLNALAQASFYQDKTVRIVAGTAQAASMMHGRVCSRAI